MGKLLPTFKTAIIDEITASISSNTSQYYAFAAFSGNTPSITSDDNFINGWQTVFGKKLGAGDIVPVISTKIWTTNTVYDIYDNNTNLANSDFYAIAQTGGYYHIYKCMDNANGSSSISNPSGVALPTQPETFQTADNYKWKYITTVSSAVYNRFATEEYFPIYPNNSIVASATINSGVDTVIISNSGVGYNAYHNGIVQFVNTSLIQIDSTAVSTNTYYNDNAIYLINNNTPSSSQLLVVNNYVSNSSGRWIYVDGVPNTSIVQAGVTNYIISPRIKFNSDGTNDPQAYAVMNTFSNSIANVIIITSGSNITWANVTVVSNSNYGTGANLQAIVPPIGGHGSDPASELFVKGMAINFKFANSESNTIITNSSYNRIGLIKNPYSMTTAGIKGTRYSANVFSEVLKATLSPILSSLFAVGSTVIGNTSGAVGTVVFCNTSTVYLTGDKNFSNNEYITSSNGSVTTTLVINTLGDVYTKNIKPLYVQTIDTVTRTNTQNEAFKLIIQI